MSWSKIKEAFKGMGVDVGDNYYEHKNYLKFPIVHLPFNHEGLLKYNMVIKYLQEELKLKENVFLFTPSGGVCVYRDGYGIKRYTTGYEIVFRYGPLCVRILFDTFNKDGKKTEVGGRYAFVELNKEFKKDGIDLMDYVTDKGEEIKNTIPAPLICTGGCLELNKVYEHVHHLDLHSAYASGISATYPELKPTYDRLYANRLKSKAQKQRIKSLFTNSTGYFQSKFCTLGGHEYALSPLAKAAMVWTKQTVADKAQKLIKAGYVPLLFNTDGIWYAKIKDGESIISDPYEDEDKGEYLGQYANDHINCKFRVKSKGSYEFIENGEYKPVVRGVPKSVTQNWNWGDIYKHTKIKTYNEDENNYLKEIEYDIV